MHVPKAAPTIKPLAFPKGFRGKQSLLLTPSDVKAKSLGSLFWEGKFDACQGLSLAPKALFVKVWHMLTCELNWGFQKLK